MKRKKIKIIRYFRMGSFPAMVMFSVGFEYDEIMEHFKKTGAKEWALGISEDKERIDNGKFWGIWREITHKKTGKKMNLYYIIFKEEFLFLDTSYTILAHEVLHVVQFAMRDAVDLEREYEFFAYTHSFVMNKCLKELRKAGKK